MRFWFGLVLLGCLCLTLGGWAQAGDATAPGVDTPTGDAVETANPAPALGAPDVTVLEPAEVPPAVPRNTLTLMMMIKQGGMILWVIMALGFVSFVLSLFHLMTLTPGREAPKMLVKRTHGMLHAGDLRGAYQMCQERDEYLAMVLRAGLKMSGHERFVIQEAMESEGERGATALWQKISYLNNIASLAPLLGLLGTVWGMMQAFGAIALEDAQVKGLTLAYSVSLAMITTAAGLLVAIPTLAVYFYLRGRVLKIIAAVEAHASEFVELIVKENEA
jgi:biopolymer transport protein ExbB